MFSFSTQCLRRLYIISGGEREREIADNYYLLNDLSYGSKANFCPKSVTKTDRKEFTERTENR